MDAPIRIDCDRIQHFSPKHLLSIFIKRKICGLPPIDDKMLQTADLLLFRLMLWCFELQQTIQFFVILSVRI